MDLYYYHWKRLFLFCLGLFIGSAFCMKWMENDLLANGEKFTILELELFYSKQKVEQILSSLDERVRTILQYHLYFDFAFMAGAYPGIASLCMIARERTSISWLKKLLCFFAALQLAAWVADIFENLWLLRWIKQPGPGKEFAWYHFIVIAKWLIALTGVILAVPFMFRKRKA